MLEHAGVISDLRFQVHFLLQEAFTTKDGKKIRSIEYIADAVYIKNGLTIVEDTKSVITQKKDSYRLKKKLLLYKYPEIIFTENL